MRVATPCGLLLHQCLYIYLWLGAGTLPSVEGFVEGGYDNQRQQRGERHTADDDPRHTGA